MIPSQAILDQITDLLAADATTIAPAALACHVHLAIAPFSPGAGLDIATLVEATFTGGGAISAGLGAQDVFTDPASGLKIIQLLEPAGGWHWDCTALTDLPQTVYGYWVSDNTDAVLYGSALLDAPLFLNAVGQGIDLPWIRFTFLSSSPF